IWSNLCTRHIPDKLAPRGHRECREKGQQIAGWCELAEGLACRLNFFEGLLLHMKIGLYVDVGGLQTFMTQPKGGHGDVDTRLQQMHGRRVSNNMRRDLFGGQAWTGSNRPLRGLFEGISPPL